MNRLSSEKSAYLSHSAYQTIDWYPWSDEAFEKARQEDKPVFLSTGAIWCHWCHVMARECFENEEIVDLLNENFICIKLDRDERPDIDRRYQQAVIAMGSGGGWPLSVFLTTDKKPFFGGTYFPPEDGHGRPGFKNVLRSVADFYKTKRGDVTEFTERLVDYLRPKPLLKEDVSESIIDNAIKNILSEYDPQNGGFGASPKFPMPGAIEFLINRYFLTGSEAAGDVIKKTLESMAKGGFHDQIRGGFHRYSVDEAWIVPHFEKMADDNAWLLRNYIDAYCVFKDDYFREVAEGIIAFIRDVLSDADGGFYASQDADVTPEDEGGYFTWTDRDFSGVLNAEEYRVLSLHLLHERGAMHHDNSKKVLFVAMESEDIAVRLGLDLKTVTEIIYSGKGKLLRERNLRKSPFVDRTLYTSLNGMLVTACLKAYRVLKDNWLKDFALKSLKRIIDLRFINNELFHSEGVNAVLDDYIFITEALIAAYEATGEHSYLNQADELMDMCIKKLWDKEEGGFFDTGDDLLGIRLKGIEDVPHPSANSVSIRLLLKLYYMTGKDVYYQYAETALRIFSRSAIDMGVHAGYYYCSLDEYFHMIKLTLQALPSSELAETALSFSSPYTSIVYADDEGCVTPCIKEVCLEPIYSTDRLREFLRRRS